MNVYDTVNKLAQEIKDSDEFKNYKEALDFFKKGEKYEF